MHLECKCHGVSGACTVRTCWASVMDFRSIGSHLKRRYDAATLVTMDQSGRELAAAHGDHKAPTRGDLVYLEASPDYCLLDQQVGESERAAVEDDSRPRVDDSRRRVDDSRRREEFPPQTFSPIG